MAIQLAARVQLPVPRTVEKIRMNRKRGYEVISKNKLFPFCFSLFYLYSISQLAERVHFAVPQVMTIRI